MSFENEELKGFTERQREVVFKRDNYKCVFCGLGKAEGLEIYAKPILAGKKSEIINGQTLCSCHKGMAGKQMLTNLYELAKAKDDKQLQDFCSQILEVYEKTGVNGHVVWKK